MPWLSAVLGAIVCWFVWQVAGEAIGLVVERLSRPIRRFAMLRLARYSMDTIMGLVWPAALGLTLLGFFILEEPGVVGTIGAALAVGAVPSALILHLVLRDRDAAPSTPNHGSDGRQGPS